MDYEFADDALVDEDGDSEAEEADDGEAAAGPAEVELEVLAAGVPLFDPPVFVHLRAATHLLLLPSIRQREMCAGCCRDGESDLVRGILRETAPSGLDDPGRQARSAAARLRVWWCGEP